MASLSVTAAGGGRSHNFIVNPSGSSIPPAQVLGIDVGPDITGAFSVNVTALDGSGTQLGGGGGATTIVLGGRSDIAVTLVPTGGGGDLAGGDDGGVAGVTISPSGVQTVYETETLNVAFNATDSAGTTLTLSATGVPTGATFTPAGASGTLAWTPDYKSAGTYTMMLTATSSDPTRTITVPITIKVLNYYDPLLDPGGAATPPVASPIGDFDKDGYGDYAVVSVNGNTSPATVPTYTVVIVYGDATGMPLAQPIPASRTKTFSFTYGAAGYSAQMSSEYVRGGDFDGDGYSDLFITDSGFNNPGRLFVFYGQPRSATAPLYTELTSESAAVDTAHLGGQPFTHYVGDFNGDKLIDVATIPYSDGTGTNSVFVWLGTNPRPGATMAYSYKLPFNYPCYQLAIQGFGDVDGDGKDELLVYDTGYNATNSTCTADGSGALRVIKWVSGNPPTIGTIPRPADNMMYPWSQWLQYTSLCDVDHDGYVDLLWPNYNTMQTHVWWGSATGLPNPMNLANSYRMAPSLGQYGMSRCIANFFGSRGVVMPSPGPSGTGGYTGPGAVDVYAGGTRTPTLTKTLANPLPADTGFGQRIASGSDFNGDGKGDLVVYATSRAWIFYGR